MGSTHSPNGILMLSFGAPGILELLILGLMCLVPLVAVVVVVLVVVKFSNRAGPPPGVAACPGCGAEVLTADLYCRQCGCPLENQTPPAS